ncbi:MAG: VOC family protein [Actinomycetota bacterium]|nr:VOC family protein [Actinomycetota bacterium]
MIQHVTRQIPPAQLEACVEFYGLLGFALVDPPAGIAGRAVWLQLGATQMHLMPVPDAAPASGHVGIVTGAYDAAVAGLQRAGHEVEPRRRHWGAARAYVRDPAGNLVELMAAPPPEPVTS